MPKQCILPALSLLKQEPEIREAVILSTCNRTEVYAVADSALLGLKALERFFGVFRDIHGSKIFPNLRLLHEDAALQLFRVASGLDSRIFGEGQILRQVRQALEMAREAGSSKATLNKLFALAIECGKSVRSETGMSEKSISVAGAAVELARLHDSSLNLRKVLIVGAGSMGQLCAKHLTHKREGPSLKVINRSQGRLDQLKQALPGTSVIQSSADFRQLQEWCDESDIIFVTTSAERFILDQRHFYSRGTRGRKLIFDLGLPRNVDPQLAAIEGITLFSLDQIQSVVNMNLQERQNIIDAAEPILFASLEAYQNWTLSQSASSTISQFRKKMHSIRKRCLSRATKDPASAQYQVLERFSEQVVNQIIHTPTVKLRNSSDSKRLLSELFDLS